MNTNTTPVAPVDVETPPMHLLLVEDVQGNWIATAFHSTEEAREFEEEHDLDGRGVIRLVTREAMLRQAPR